MSLTEKPLPHSAHIARASCPTEVFVSIRLSSATSETTEANDFDGEISHKRHTNFFVPFVANFPLSRFRKKPNGNAQIRNQSHVGVFQPDEYLEDIPITSLRGIPGSRFLPAHLSADRVDVPV